MNYFGETQAAERYARYRPYVHPLIVEHILAMTGPVRAALDVGCGTGQSTLALLAMADNVIGVDISAPMLSHAPRDPRLGFAISPAESLPFETARFDLVTSGLAFHWFDQPAFLREARRVLRPNGTLALYNDGFMGEMIGEAGYRVWQEGSYLARFPTPARNLKAGGEDQWAQAGFESVASDSFDHEVVLTLEEWAGYLSTQSNVIAGLEDGRETIEGVTGWLCENGAPFFKDAPRSFRFRCWLDLYRLSDRSDQPA